MPAIFLSYDREKQVVAHRFAEAFGSRGFSVRWDTTLTAGGAHDSVTERALSEAKAVVVFWSPRSLDSRRVRVEAASVDRIGKLFPGMQEDRGAQHR